MKNALVLAFTLWGCDGASASLRLSNQTPAARSSVLANGTSLRLKMIAAYLTEDVDPVTMDNLSRSEMIWIDPQCGGDVAACNVDGFALPAGGPRITEYFDLARPTTEINADLSSENLPVAPGTYRYARVELCKAYGASEASVPTMMWAGADMTAEQPFTSGDCGRTSLAFDPPLVLGAGDAVAITLGYDLDRAVVSGTPAPGHPGAVVGSTDTDGSPHVFRACADVDATHRDCMDFPAFAPSASKL
jgi:hypothetical protein